MAGDAWCEAHGFVPCWCKYAGYNLRRPLEGRDVSALQPPINDDEPHHIVAPTEQTADLLRRIEVLEARVAELEQGGG